AGQTGAEEVAGTGPRTVLYCAADLVWASRIKATAEAVGVAARPVRSAEMLAARMADTRVGGLIVDLEAFELGIALIGHLRSAGGPAAGARVVAFGPHVEVDRLEAARRAGADVVMTRGAFSGRLGEVLSGLASGGGT
ncbi:MAG TPA: hypothetical protein VD963_02895, partial [Phycisphaerales bacterium]|nr:hypothetical protein [Phycisphaerales bacterium]